MNIKLMKTTKKLLAVVLAMFVTAIGISLTICADIGLNPFWTFTLGISDYLGIANGFIIRMLGITFILAALTLGVKPGISTLLDMILVGYFVDMINRTVTFATPEIFLLKVILNLFGLVIFCIGVFLTLKVNLGAGPKESFTLAIMHKTNRSIVSIKLLMESIILIAGILLGGPYGIGTVISTIFTGKILAMLFKIFKYNPVLQGAKTS